MYRLYDDPISGNGYKVRLVLAQLHIAYQYHTLDIMKGETRQPTFLTKNPLGKIPVLETTGADYLVGNRYGIADIALYAYSHVAEEGGFDLSGYPALGAWLKRVARQPNHVTITDVPAAAGTAA